MHSSQILMGTVNNIIEEADDREAFLEALAARDLESAREAAGFTECQFGFVLDALNGHFPGESAIDIPWDIGDCDESDVELMKFFPHIEPCPECGGPMDTSFSPSRCASCARGLNNEN